MSSFVKREGGVLKPIAVIPKMYIAFNMAHNPIGDPRGPDDGFRTGLMFKGMAGSEDELRVMLKGDLRGDPEHTYAIFEMVRMISSEEDHPRSFTIIDRNMR